MRMVDIIRKKRDGHCLTEEEIRFFINGYTNGEIPDYQASAFAMAVYFQGMNDQELICLTDAMAHSGEMVDLSEIPGIKVDKHSTGGVGDKTTLIVVPVVAACGVPVAKVSGKGLGHTGGTVDKLESIPGLETALSREKFLEIVKTAGLCVAGQSANMAPADKKLYALRDVTATVQSMPLIASSIMSKKIAAGADAIVLDVKTGSGAFMETLEDAVALSQKMVAIGEGVGRKTIALITDMDRPLGFAIGNSMEVQEAIEVLCGKGPEDLRKVALMLAANMLLLAGKGSYEDCITLAEEAVSSGKALEKLSCMVKAQGGDAGLIIHPEQFPKAAYCQEVKAPCSGWITHMDTAEIGNASVVLGAGRSKKEDSIDYTAGIRLAAKTGDPVKEGDALAILYTNQPEKLKEAEKRFLQAVTIAAQEPPREKLVLARVTADGAEYF